MLRYEHREPVSPRSRRVRPQPAAGGLGLGIPALALTILVFCLVAFLAITRRDVQSAARVPHAAGEAHLRVEITPESDG
jgi:hypothetical protein